MKTNNKILIGAGIVVIALMILKLIPLLNMEPLQFYIYNYDVEKHEVTVEIFDPYGKSIFNETYISSPEVRINSPIITKKKEDYLFKVSLDNNITETFESKKEFGEVVIWLYGYESGIIVPIRILQTTN